MLQRFHPSLLRNFSFVSSLLWTTTAPRSIAAAFGSNNNSCNMSNTADEMLDACILPLTSRSHKGSSGRVGILGGNERYTGAPYYAGYSALKVGADLSYVFCAEEAAQPIKSYSPELMVAPVYSAKQFSSLDKDDPHAEHLLNSMVQEVVSLMDQMHVLVIGPGLGRCPLVMRATSIIIENAIQRNLPLVIDADGLWLLTQAPYRHLLKDYDKVVLTPNLMEYRRLLEANDGDVSQAFSRAIIVQKGAQDVIYRGDKQLMVCDEKGGLKRSGGIGDVLAGTLGTFMAWNTIMSKSSVVDPVWSCWCACYLVKRSTRHAYERKGRAMTAPDVLESIWANVDDRTGTTKS